MTTSGEPHWLDSEEQEAWLALASLLISLPAALDAQLQRDAGISHFECQAIAGLSRAPDHTLRMSELAAFVEGSLHRLSQVIGRLKSAAGCATAPTPPTAA